MKNTNENTRTCKNENKENTEISNNSLRVSLTETAPSPRVNVLDKLPCTIEKSTTKYKSPLKLNSLLTHSKYPKALTIEQSLDSIAMQTRSRSCILRTVTKLQQNLSVSSRTRLKVALATSKVELREALHNLNERAEQLSWRSTRRAIANAVLNPETRKIMEYHHLMQHRNLNIRAI